VHRDDLGVTDVERHGGSFRELSFVDHVIFQAGIYEGIHGLWASFCGQSGLVVHPDVDQVLVGGLLVSGSECGVDLGFQVSSELEIVSLALRGARRLEVANVEPPGFILYQSNLLDSPCVGL
jgi:hypothetical protein